LLAATTLFVKVDAAAICELVGELLDTPVPRAPAAGSGMLGVTKVAVAVLRNVLPAAPVDVGVWCGRLSSVVSRSRNAYECWSHTKVARLDQRCRTRAREMRQALAVMSIVLGIARDRLVSGGPLLIEWDELMNCLRDRDDIAGMALDMMTRLPLPRSVDWTMVIRLAMAMKGGKAEIRVNALRFVVNVLNHCDLKMLELALDNRFPEAVGDVLGPTEGDGLQAAVNDNALAVLDALWNLAQEDRRLRRRFQESLGEKVLLAHLTRLRELDIEFGPRAGAFIELAIVPSEGLPS
jgi:hypothetical protein